MSAGDRPELLLRGQRAIVAAALALLIIFAWTYTVVTAMGMSKLDYSAMGMDMGMDMGMSMEMGAWIPWTGTEAALVFVMWVVMMVAMMLPAASPMVLMYAHINRHRLEDSSAGAVAAFLIGYLALWVIFSVLAATAQWLLHTAALLSPEMVSASPVFSATLLIGAGAYQFTPWKNRCLAKCRSPMGFLMAEWRSGVRGAFIMGLRHGLYCLGCCWLLMALLFVVGVMNLLWIALIALAVLAEKILPKGVWVSRGIGAAAIGWGAYILALRL